MNEVIEVIGGVLSLLGMCVGMKWIRTAASRVKSENRKEAKGITEVFDDGSTSVGKGDSRVYKEDRDEAYELWKCERDQPVTLEDYMREGEGAFV